LGPLPPLGATPCGVVVGQHNVDTPPQIELSPTLIEDREQTQRVPSEEPSLPNHLELGGGGEIRKRRSKGRRVNNQLLHLVEKLSNTPLSPLFIFDSEQEGQSCGRTAPKLYRLKCTDPHL